MKKIIILLVFLSMYIEIPQAIALQFDPVTKGASLTLSNQNRTATSSGTTWSSARTTISYSTGKYYFEISIDSIYLGRAAIMGVGTSDQNLADGNYCGNSVYSWGWGGKDAKKRHVTEDYYGSLPSVNDIVGFAVDYDTHKIWVAVNNVWQESGDPVAETSPMFNDLSGDLYIIASLYGSSSVSLVQYGDRTYNPPTGYTYYEVFSISGMLKHKESDASGAAYNYFILDATNHGLYEFGTADATGAYSVNVANSTDEYCGVIIDNIGGAVYDGYFGTDTTAADGTWSITNAGWTTGDTVWAFFVDPDKVYKTIAASFVVDASNTVSGTHEEAGSPALGTMVYAAGFGTATGYLPPNPIFDFATGQ